MTKTVSTNPVTFRVIIPKKLATNSMDGAIRDACIKDAKAMVKDLQNVTKTWKDAKPVIQGEVKLVPSGTVPYPLVHQSFTVSAWPKNDNSKGYWKYIWLDLGTKVRYATMTKNFIPKTRAGQLNSWKGRGGMLFVSKKHPRPGIKARKFTRALRLKWEKPFRDHMVAATKKAVQLSGHKI